MDEARCGPGVTVTLQPQLNDGTRVGCGEVCVWGGHYQHQEAINKTVREAAKMNVFNTGGDRKKEDILCDAVK